VSRAAAALHEPRVPLVLVYDDRCPLCRSLAEGIRRRDRGHRIELAPASGAAALLARHGIPTESSTRDVHLFLPDGRALHGVDVVAPVIAELPRWSWLAPLLRIRPFSYLFAGAWLLSKQFRHQAG
jgi:predicted DCC family thiol-disulfide oxidoreductase YuxK